ncbi:hypothetical protein [Macellibacteroides fermentans]|uniref:hypothetical protein n=1 Tax=Macellibacteroides fermentans TaxID=879969 RepID=UPI00406CFBE3
MSIRIAHIHTDKKFLYAIERFRNINIYNLNILISNCYKYDKNKNRDFIAFKYSTNNLKKIINLCNQFDIVVIYDLNLINSYISNRLKPSIKIIWRFFGLELYSKMPDYVYSSLTASVLDKNQKSYLQSKVLEFWSVSKQLLKYRSTFKKEFNEAIRKVNYFCGVSDMEYEFLKNEYSYLPKFLQWPLSHIEPLNNIEKKMNQIIIGNNRSAYNNHLNILEILGNYSSVYKIQFLLLFNYGQNNYYSNIVREKAQAIKDLTILEDFLSREDFSTLYATASAFVMNGYRQMALGNIFEALSNDVKIYLNKRNIIYEWLIREGFKIFSIDNLLEDLKEQKIQLSEQDVIHNRKILNKFTQKYNEKDFHQNIFKMITNIDS